MQKHTFWGIIEYTSETKKEEVRLCQDAEVLLQHK